MRPSKFLILLFVCFVHEACAGVEPDPKDFGMVRAVNKQGLSPYNDKDVVGATGTLDTFLNQTKCEELARGDMCYKKNAVPWHNYKCHATWCHYKPTHAYHCNKSVELFQSENGNYPPRKMIYTCKYPDWPCYKTVAKPRSKSDRLWCPQTKCTHEYYVTDAQYLWANLDGVWKKEWVVVKYPWHCVCNGTQCRRCSE